MDVSGHYSSPSGPKVERKYVEKNRRNLMKTLYSNLASLLPSHNSKELLAVPDQIDEAVNYIKSLQKRLEKSKEKKEMLTSTSAKRYDPVVAMCSTTSQPQIEIHEMGPNMDIVLINGLSNPLSFYEIIRVLHQQGAEIFHANFSATGNSIVHILHKKIGNSKLRFEANTILERLNELLHGSSSSNFDVEAPPDIWDFDFSLNSWENVN